MDKREEIKEKGEDKEAEKVRLKDRIGSIQETAFQRFPLIFTVLGTFGLVATLYGFEGVLDRIPLFADNPLGMLLLGFGVLVGTGTLYRQLNGGGE